jgi:hypothetical protein
MTSNSTCVTTATANSNSITMTVNPLPVVSFSGLAASYLVTDPPATLTGSPAGGVFSGPGISGNTFTPSAAGVGGPYTIVYSYTDANGCRNSSSQQTTVTSSTCTVPSLPGAITGPTSVCANQNLAYSITAVSGATSYTWTVPAGFTIKAGQGSKSIKVRSGSTGGNITVKANNSCGSSGVRSLTVAVTCPGPASNENITNAEITATDVLNPEAIILSKPDLNVFPNPFKNTTTIRFSLPETGNVSIKVRDLSGKELKVLYQGKVQSGSFNDLSFDGSKYSSGIYILTLQTDKGKQITKKLIITR